MAGSTNIKAIETHYKGYRFRSRLEARWAVFFEASGIPWQYEREGYDLGDGILYLPDFWIPCDPKMVDYPNAGYWCEIKPTDPTDDEMEKARRLAMLSKHHVRMLVGPPGQHREWYVNNIGRCGWSDGNYMPDEHPQAGDSSYLLLSLFLHSVDQSRPHVGISEAINAARAARFEHGETPK